MDAMMQATSWWKQTQSKSIRLFLHDTRCTMARTWVNIFQTIPNIW